MKRNILSLRDVVFLNVVAVTSLRWTASAASIGPSALTLWVLAVLCFFLPEGFAVAHLSSKYPGVGGLYRWTNMALGPRHAFFCGWCYWVNNLLYFPSMLMYVSANVALAISWWFPETQLGDSRLFVIAMTLGTLWLVALLAFLGMNTGKWVQNLGGIGNWIPAVLVAVLGAILYFRGEFVTPITAKSLIPDLSTFDHIAFFSQMCFALAGLELVSFVDGEIKDSERVLSKGILIAAPLITSVYLLGTLGILGCSLPTEINLVNGIYLPTQKASNYLGWGWLGGVSISFIVIAGVGAVAAWFAGVSRVPYLVGIDKYLPSRFAEVHPKHGTPHIAIAVQTALATLFTLLSTLGTATPLEAAYQVLVDMCLILYFIPFCYLFVSLGILVWREQRHGGRKLIATSAVGFITTLLAIAISVLPLGQTTWAMTLKTLAGTLTMLLLALVVYRRNVSGSSPA